MCGWPAAAVVAIALVLTSVNPVHRFTAHWTHGLGVMAYAVVGTPIIAWAYSFFAARLARGTTQRRTGLRAGLAGLSVLALAFALLYPLANSGKLGPGSDRDEALNIGVSELCAGHYPYYARTYLHAPLTPLPGALVLAAPFHFLGNAAYQNVWWIAVYGALLGLATRSWRAGAVLTFGMLLASPELLREFVTGGDMGTNAIYVLAFTQLLVWAVCRAETPAWWWILAAIAFGVALASRPNWLLIVPLVFALLSRLRGWRAAVLPVLLGLVTAAGLTLPFYWYDPPGFSPMHVAAFIGHVDQYIPHGSLAIYALTATATLTLAVRQYRLPALRQGAPPATAACSAPDFQYSTAWLFLHAAAVQALPALLAATILGVKEGVLGMSSAHSTSRALQLVGTGHLYVYGLVYACVLLNRTSRISSCTA